MTLYLLDTNVFIQAKRNHYGFDFCPAFWDWLVQQNRAGSVASIEKVADELRVGGDDLAAWAEERGDDFFLRPDDDVEAVLTTVSDWVANAGYESAAAATFLQVADYWLVAHALAHDCVVVTHETRREKTRRENTIGKVKIPNVCDGLSVRWADPYDMLRREQARFVLPPAAGPL